MKVFINSFLAVASRHVLMSAWFNSSFEFHKTVEIAKSQLGVIDMGFLLLYAIGNFVLGVLGDSYRQKRVLYVSSFVACGIYLIILVLSYLKLMNFYMYLVLFSIMGFAQSSIWPMTVAIMGMTYPKEARGSIIGFWTINSAVGDMVGYFISSVLLSSGLSWLVISSCTLFIFTLVILSNYLFLPDHISNTENKPRIPVLAALSLPSVIFYCMCYACIKLIHLSIMIWVPYFMYDHLGMDTGKGGIIMVLYSIGGMCGSIGSGYLSDKVDDRSYVLLGMVMASVPAINMLSFELGKHFHWSCVIIFTVGVLISGGSNFLSGVIAADMCELESEFEAKSTLTGLVDASGGIGGSIGQIIIGLLGKENASSLFLVMIGFNIVGVITILPIVSRVLAKKRYTIITSDDLNTIS